MEMETCSALLSFPCTSQCFIQYFLVNHPSTRREKTGPEFQMFLSQTVRLPKKSCLCLDTRPPRDEPLRLQDKRRQETDGLADDCWRHLSRAKCASLADVGAKSPAGPPPCCRAWLLTIVSRDEFLNHRGRFVYRRPC